MFLDRVVVLYQPVTAIAGSWRNLEVAIKTVVFESAPGEAESAAANECRIAADLVHPNLVATYSHFVRPVRDADGADELCIYKMYLVQVRHCNKLCCSTLLQLRIKQME